MLDAVLEPPTVDDSSEQEEVKYNLRRAPGATGLLPCPGSRRFSELYMQTALSWDPTLDAYPSKDQSSWDDFDIWCQENWRKWSGLL